MGNVKIEVDWIKKGAITSAKTVHKDLPNILDELPINKADTGRKAREVIYLMAQGNMSFPAVEGVDYPYPNKLKQPDSTLFLLRLSTN